MRPSPPYGPKQFQLCRRSGPTLFLPPNLAQYEALKILLVNLAWDFHTGAHWQHTLSGHENRTLDTNANPPFFTSIDSSTVRVFASNLLIRFAPGAVAAAMNMK